jgi:cell filamentation protein, protein adenylyltransferase
MNSADFLNSPSGAVIQVPTGYAAFVPNPLPPALPWTSPLATSLSEADRKLGELAGLGRLLANPHLLVHPFMRREAVLSSRIEGTRASLGDLYAYEAMQLSFLEKGSDVKEVHNYVRALEYGLKRLETLPISLRLIRELHAQLMEGVRGEHLTPGEFRRTQNWIGPAAITLQAATFVPPPVPEMQQALAAFEDFLHRENELPPLVRLALVHYQFEAIHPFLDGNGRVGRLLVSLLLCAWNLLPEPLLYLSAYFESNRHAYYDHLLAVSQAGAWEAWLLFFLRGVAVQAEDAAKRIHRLQHLREAFRQQFQAARAAARLLQVVDLLFERPLITIPQIQSSLKVQFPVAQRYVERLVSAGVLREITGNARNRVYRADAIMQAIEEPL